MSSRFGFSSLEVPELPEPLNIDEIEVALAHDKGREALETFVNELNESRRLLKAATDEVGKFEGFKVPQCQVTSETLKTVERAVWLRMELLSTRRGWRLKYALKCNLSEYLPDKKKVLAHAQNLNPQDAEPTSSERPSRKHESHLSINAKKTTLVILSISDEDNLQFNRSGAAISTSLEDLPAILEAGVVTKNGDIMNYDKVAYIPDSEKKNDGCKLAYFIIDPSMAGPSPTSPCHQGNTQDIKDAKAFNIHLDLIGPKKRQNGKKPKYYIPIIIDPDVRHPGGFGGGG